MTEGVFAEDFSSTNEDAKTVNRKVCLEWKTNPRQLCQVQIFIISIIFWCMLASKFYLLCLKGYPVLAFVLIMHMFKIQKPFLCCWSAHSQEKVQANVLQSSAYSESHLHLKISFVPKIFLSLQIFAYFSELTTILY